MKKITIAFSLIITTICFAQITPTNVALPITDIQMEQGSNKSLTWFTSSWGNGFGHRIINYDPGYKTLLNFQSRNNSATWSTSMSITSQGDVGIGTTNPSQKLHVNGNILSNKLMLNDPNLTSDWNTIWQSGFYESISATNGPEPDGWFWGLNMNHNSNSSTSKYNGQIAIKNSSTSPTMYFRSTNGQGAGTWGKIIAEIGNKTIISGNVGIGTKNPSEKLTVKGKILCGEVEVVMASTIPADYVFQKYYTGASVLKADYVMPSLEEVEAFTKANHHLPEVPSAATIKEDGLQLKEMTTLLLQKVEELTLYTIEQEKRIKSLETKLVEKN